MKLFKRLLAIFLILGIFMLTGYSFDVQISDECSSKGNMAFDYFCDVVDANHVELTEFIEKYGGA